MTLSIKSFRLFFLTIVVFIGICLNSVSVQAQFDDSFIRAVDASAGTCGDGTAWSSAYKYLQDALDEAAIDEDITEIWVAAGTYVPDQNCANPGGTGSKDATFLLDFNNITILGGFEGGVNGETDALERNPELNITVLSGLLGSTAEEVCGDPDAGSCTTAHLGPGCDDLECCEMVCAVMPSCCQFEWDADCAEFAVDVCSTCGVPGSGDCHDPALPYTPGCEDAECCAAVCEGNPFCCDDVWDNFCGDLADIHCPPDEPPALPNAYHVVTADGVNLTVRLDGFTITEGVATGISILNNLGGGMFIIDASPAVVRCIFINNSAPGHGGGAIAIQDSSHPLIINCQFFDNHAAEGGAIHSELGSAGATFVNCLFTGNQADIGPAPQRHGGAIDHGTGGVINLINCTITENIALDEGGAIFLHDGGTATIVNSILWGNTPDEIEGSTGAATVTYSDIDVSPIWPGTGNINDDPLFLDVANGDYRLAFGSPCIDMGDSNVTVIPLDDYDVNQDGDEGERTPDLNLLMRIVNGFVDMGAYEVEPCPWDLDGNGVVGTSDLLLLFAQWGTNGPADFNNDGIVNTEDLLILFANWGPCPGTGLPPPLTLEEELADACLTQANWDEYVGVMMGSANQATKDRYQCWMEHYLNDCNKCTCLGPVPCPAPDPFDD